MLKFFLELRLSKNIHNSPIPIILNVNAMSNFHPITGISQCKRVSVFSIKSHEFLKIIVKDGVFVNGWERQ